MRLMRNFFIFCLLASSYTAAETLPQQLKNCAELTEDQKRLTCYDTVSSGLVQHAERQFGIEAQQLVDEGPDTLVGTIASVREGAYKKHTIILANGQIWRQTVSGRITWKSGEEIKVERGALGSFFMRKLSGGRAVRVKRIN